MFLTKNKQYGEWPIHCRNMNPALYQVLDYILSMTKQGRSQPPEPTMSALLGTDVIILE
jgi:hypothetical protein